MTPAAQEHRIHLAGSRAMVEEAKRIRAELCESRGLPPSSSCQMCGRTDPATASECQAPGVCEWIEE